MNVKTKIGFKPEKIKVVVKEGGTEVHYSNVYSMWFDDNSDMFELTNINVLYDMKAIENHIQKTLNYIMTHPKQNSEG